MSRGIQRERDLCKRLEAEGWWALRAPASLGSVDVVAMKNGHPSRFYEVKSTAAGPFHSFGPQDRAELLVVAGQAGAEAILAYKPPRAEWRFLPPSEWP